MGFFSFITDFFSSVTNVISSVINTVVSVIIPSPEPEPTTISSYSQPEEERSAQYELAGFSNITSNMVPSPLIFTEDGIRVATYGLWNSGEGTTQKRLLEIGMGELELVNGVELNGKPISEFTGSSASIYNGTSTQAIDSRYDDTPNKIGGLRDTAYLALTLEGNEKLTGDPLVTVNVAKGIKMPRWNGADWTTLTPAASGNPAAVIRFYLLLDRDMGGAGLAAAEVDDASFGAVYDWAEVLVSDGAGGTEPRARITYKIDSFKQWAAILDDMKGSFGGYFTTDGRVIKLKVRKAEIPVHDYEQGKLAGSILPGSFSYHTFSDQERPNRLLGIFKDPTEEGNDAWTRTPPIDDYADQQTNPRGIVVKEITFRALSRQSQAIRMLTQMMNDYRVNWYGGKFRSDIDSVPREEGDVIRAKYPTLGDGVSFHEISIERIRENPDHTREIVWKAYNSSIFNDNLEVDPVTPNYARAVNPSTATDEVTALTITEVGGFVNADGTWVGKINCTFTAPNQTLGLVRYRVLAREGAGAYEFVKYVSKLETGFNLGITAEVGKSYTVKVQAENDRNVLSGGAESNTITIAGKDAPPSPVTGYTVTLVGQNLKHKWNAITDADLFGYRISRGDVYETSVLITEDYLAGTEFTEAAARNGTRTYWIVAIDNSGNKSAPTSYQVNVTNVSNNIVFSWDIAIPADIADSNNMAVEYINVPGYKTDIPSMRIDSSAQWDDVTDFEGVAWDFPVLSAAADLTTMTFDLGGVGTGAIVIDIKTLLQGFVDFVVEINTSDDNLTWNGWQVYTPATYTLRYFKLKISATSADVTTGNVNVYGLSVVFDIVDRTEEKTVTITDSAGLVVTYDTPFTDIPKNSLGTLELFDSDTAKYLHPKSYTETATSFTLKARNIETGSLDTGSIRYKARGYLLSANKEFKEVLASIAGNLTNAAIEFLNVSGYKTLIPTIRIDTSVQWDDTTDFQNVAWNLPVVAAQASFTTTAFDLGLIGTGKFTLVLGADQIGDITVSYEINRSDDDITYNGWETFTSGVNYTCRYFKLKILFTSDAPPVANINYYDMNMTVSNLS